MSMQKKINDMKQNSPQTVHPYTSFCHAVTYALINSIGIDKNFDNYCVEIGVCSKCSDKSLSILKQPDDVFVNFPSDLIMEYYGYAQMLLSGVLFDVFSRAKLRVGGSLQYVNLVVRIMQYPEGCVGCRFVDCDIPGKKQLIIHSPDKVLAVSRLTALPVEDCCELMGKLYET